MIYIRMNSFSKSLYRAVYYIFGERNKQKWKENVKNKLYIKRRFWIKKIRKKS